MYPDNAVRPRQSRRETIAAGSDALRKHRPDYWLLVIIVLLLSIGLIVVYSISPALSASHNGGGNFVTKQLIAIVLSIVAFMITSRIPLRQWRAWQLPIIILAVLGTIIALVTPVVPEYPAHRWIRLGSLSLQSVEVLKFALLISVGAFLAARVREGKIGDYRRTLRPLLIASAAIGLVVAFIQSDLGSTGVIVAMIAVMAFVAGMPMRRIIIIGLIVLFGTFLAVSSTPYRRARLATYLHPESNCLTTSYQACQALIAVGSGGMVGLGLGKGVQAYGYLPEAQNDSIFAIYAEKFGFIGSTLLVGLFGVLFARLRLIAERAPDMFSRLIVVGVLTWLSTQAIINIGAMLGLLPLKGITLPLVSYGGTSVLFVGAALGLVFQVSHYTSFQSRKPLERREARRAVR